MENEPATFGSGSAMTGECRTVDPQGKKFWNTRELADKLGVNAKWVMNRVNRGQIAAQKMGALRVVAQAEAQRLFDMKERGVLEGLGMVAKMPAYKMAAKPNMNTAANKAVRKMVKRAERVVERLQEGDANLVPPPPAMINVNAQKMAELMNLYVSLAAAFEKLGLRIGLTAF